MTYLMVNLNDAADCRDAIHRLRDLLRHAPRAGVKRRARHRLPGVSPTDPATTAELSPAATPTGPSVADPLHPDSLDGSGSGKRIEQLHELPLPKKLHRIAQRDVFRHLRRIASEVSTPLSLPELDRHLGFQPNKMRSLKAIMAKLEHRFGLQFLVADPQGGVDESGNPRYVMPQRMRTQILRVVVV